MADSGDATSELPPRASSATLSRSGASAVAGPASRDTASRDFDAPRFDAGAGRRGPPSTDPFNETKRINPRSPRAALEPERVPMPTKWSKSARHPLVIAGNAVFTILILLAIIVGVGFVVGKHRFEAPGPLAEHKVVNIPPRSGIRDIADLLTNEGVIE